MMEDYALKLKEKIKFEMCVPVHGCLHDSLKG